MTYSNAYSNTAPVPAPPSVRAYKSDREFSTVYETLPTCRSRRRRHLSSNPIGMPK